MPVPYFYEASLTSNPSIYILSEETSKHCIQVLRMKAGDRIDLTNGLGELYEATISDANKKNTTVQIIKQKTFAPAAQKIILGISLLKNVTRLEWLFEKATEMGVHAIVPLICDHTIHERFKTERMQNILQSAMIQSQQVWLPILSEPITFDKFINEYKASQKLIAHCETQEKVSIKNIEIGNESILLIGPEGDFSSTEIESALKLDYTPIHLGPTRLRTETAGLFALSILKKF
jgi:16S rRNA (uracil1498-N3)-methyltransferase